MIHVTYIRYVLHHMYSHFRINFRIIQFQRFHDKDTQGFFDMDILGFLLMCIFHVMTNLYRAMYIQRALNIRIKRALWIRTTQPLIPTTRDNTYVRTNTHVHTDQTGESRKGWCGWREHASEHSCKHIWWQPSSEKLFSSWLSTWLWWHWWVGHEFLHTIFVRAYVCTYVFTCVHGNLRGYNGAGGVGYL